MYFDDRRSRVPDIRPAIEAFQSEVSRPSPPRTAGFSGGDHSSRPQEDRPGGGEPERLRFDSAILDIGYSDDKFEDLRWYWNVFYIDPGSGKRRWQRNHVTVYLDTNGKGVLEVHGLGSRPVGIRDLPANSLKNWYPDPIEYDSFLGERKLITTVSSARVKEAGKLDPTQIGDRSAVKDIAAKAVASLSAVVVNPKDWVLVTIELKATDADTGLWVVTFWPSKSKTEDTIEILVLLDGTVLLPR